MNSVFIIVFALVVGWLLYVVNYILIKKLLDIGAITPIILFVFDVVKNDAISLILVLICFLGFASVSIKNK
ncbi:hypothetical protein [Vibrio salinus]|uniref:hypothetical protein n=1 Tax=Vibrio salinus TaxID=2899784 RepID=UPI001E5BB439|nr:hypothetical protein [Vibrio salinus]MCE0494159.1 hypothetical protein [Vibrio salinus]